jgi:hypothetical protein
MTSFRTIERRTFLRGVGTAIALPWLEAMMPRQTHASTPDRSNSATDIAGPRRIAFLYAPNGVHPPDWTPKTTGLDYELTPILKPLAPFKDHFSLISGLAHQKAQANGDGGGDHARSVATFLTGAQAYKTAGEDIRVGVSADQIAAEKIGHLTRFRSLELGLERGRQAGNCDSGYSCAYSSNISWRTPAQPVTKETNPRLVFERLFGKHPANAPDRNEANESRYRKSILDLVREDAHSLRSKLGQTDRRKLDEYITGVRELERRVQTPQTVDLGHGRIAERPGSTPTDFVQHARLMSDMLVLAFQTDSTRVSTFMLGNGSSNRSYPSIGVHEGHHSLSHHRGDREKQDQISRINHLHVQQLAHLLDKMHSVPEGDATLLDNTLLVYGCSIQDGNRHNHNDLPILLAGRGGSHVRPSGHIQLPSDTPLMNLFLTMLESVGVEIDQAGDSTGRLDVIRNA